MTASPRHFGLLLGEPRSDPPEGFEAIDRGLTWLVDRSAVGVPDALACGGLPWPLLTSLGRLASDGSLVLANLEELGAVEVVGEPADVLALADSLAEEIAADHFGGGAQIICVDWGPRLAGLDRVRIVESPRQALAEAELHRARARGAEARRGALPDLRARGLRGVAPPVVVIDPHARDPATWVGLRALAGPGLVVVTAGGEPSPPPRRAGRPAPGPRWVFRLTGRRLRWEPVGVDLEFGPPWALPQSAYSSRCALQLSSTAPANCIAGRGGRPDEAQGGRRSAPRAAPCPGIGGFGWTGEPPDVRLGACTAGVVPGPVELQVLGVVQAVGAFSPFTSQRALDLACYLAFHRDGAAADRLRYWLWRRGEPVPSSKTFANVVSRARVCLGRDDDGAPYLSRVSAEGVYRLSADVTTDLERLTAWRRLAEQMPPQQALECLRAALWLVRGAPFGGGSGGTFSWADVSWRSHVEYLVDSTAHRLADVALELGRNDVARWATLRGLAVTPDCEQCLQRRITAARRSGRRREADLIMRDMDRRGLEPVPALEGLEPVDASPWGTGDRRRGA
ncbi:MAG: bacterial transcriptional activator domain-containing protein [bacterium]|nr:bacterial transcriptional activator domain-containing protein [bacterium]